MKFLKGLTIAFIGTLVLNLMGVNASESLSFSKIILAIHQTPSTYVTDKGEDSYQYVKNINSTSSASSLGTYRTPQAALMGKDAGGASCTTDYKTLAKGSWTVLGDTNQHTGLGCGLYPVNGKGYLLLRTKSNYSTNTYFWGTWVTTKTLYDKVK